MYEKGLKLCDLGMGSSERCGRSLIIKQLVMQQVVHSTCKP
jgi:hypothetical protein